MKRRLAMAAAGFLVGTGILLGTAVPAEAVTGRVIGAYATEAECNAAIPAARAIWGVVYCRLSPTGTGWWLVAHYG
ncbi:hypothetical protein [Rhizohabitans arisaemae]|uniref:hypothetical protein n=1 Tax=Rhizohabitans arisaemae TaxID=2720610 RepID=UPI0024B22225|nr:hypothetical protein [Rhizohabitans arisaemae]